VAKPECVNLKTNLEKCTCTYTACGRRGRCCECLQHHLQAGELPGCCFPAEVERTYDRSIARFVAVHSR